MQTVIIVIHLMIVIAMIAVILLQRSEGGALGIGGGGGGSMFSARGSANLLTRATTILAVVFFATSLFLGILAKQQQDAPSILDTGTTGPGDALPLGDDAIQGTGEGILDVLREQSGEADVPAPPTDDGPATAPAVPGTPATPQIPTGQ